MEENLITYFENKGTVVDVPANKPLSLDDPALVWIVRAGKVDVFAMAVDENMSPGRRTHVMRVETGGLLFGMKAGDSDPHFNLIAVGFPGTEVIQLPKAILDDYAKQLPTIFSKAVEKWILDSANGVFVGIPPKSFEPLVPRIEIALNDGCFGRPQKSVVWVQPVEGAVMVAADDGLELQSGSPFFPATNNGWIVSKGQSRVATESTLGCIEKDVFWQGLSQFHAIILDTLLRNETQRSVEDRIRLKKKAAHDASAVRQGLSLLASVLSKEKKRAVTGFASKDHLLTACKWVGAAQNIEIKAPSTVSGGKMEKDRMAMITRSSKLRMRQVLLRGKWWSEDNGPLLASYEDTEEPVALLPVSTGNYELVNPEDDSRIPVTAAVANSLAPLAYMFYRPFPEKVLSRTDIIRFAFRGSERDIAVVISLSLIGGFLALLVPMLTGTIFDTVVPEADKVQLYHIFAILVAAALSTGLFEITKAVAMLRAESRMNSAVQNAIWDRLLSLPLPFFRDYSSGDLASRAEGINMMRRILSGAAGTSIIGGVFSVYYLGLLFYYDMKLAMVAIVLAVVAGLFTLSLGMLGLRHQRHIVELEGKISGMMLQYITGISKLRVAGAEVHAFATWAKSFTEKKKRAFSIGTVSNFQETFNAVFPVISSMVIFFALTSFMAASLETGEAPMSIGSFIAFNAAFVAFLNAYLQMNLTVITVLSAVPFYERAKPILESLPEVNLQKKDPGELKGGFEVNQVEFRYRSDLPLVLKGVSMQLKPGEFCAVVGASGSGKSTLLRLLLGFEQPENGSTYYDGQLLSELDTRELRRQIGVVLQSGRLMTGDIFHNIIGSSSLTMDDAWEAARMAGLDKDIDLMPMGMNTVVSEGGATLSGGQRQRLLIARALVNKPRIIFFDEATSALDNQTQSIVSERLERLQATRLVIAHRLSTIINADRIFVMHAGKVVEEGTYDELMKKDGLFAELAKRQLA